jgi:hypothetical protein
MYATKSVDTDLVIQLGQAFSFRGDAALPTQVGGVVARRAEAGRAEWDRFAGRTSVSFQADHDHLKAQALIGARQLLMFEFVDSASQQKIGQCAVLKRGRHFEIQDGIQLTEDQQGHWQQAMRALLAELGAGTYSYGGLWSCEAPREAEFALLRDVTVDQVRPFAVQGVDFAKWPNWDRYWAKVSDSVRYESKYAPERVPGLRLERFTGWKMLKAIPAIMDLQRASYARKDMGYNRVKQALRYAYYMARCGRSLEVVLAVADAGVLAAYYGGQVGDRTYYIFGGQKAGSGGANWYLLKEMTRAAFEAAPTGRFVMGNVDYAVHEEASGGGLLRARRALRVTDFETSMVNFTYRP